MCLCFLPCGLLASNRIDWTHPQGRHVPRNSNTRQLQFPRIFAYLGRCRVCSLFPTSCMANSDSRSGGIASSSWWPIGNSVCKDTNTGREQSVALSSSSTKSKHTIKVSQHVSHVYNVHVWLWALHVCFLQHHWDLNNIFLITQGNVLSLRNSSN